MTQRKLREPDEEPEKQNNRHQTRAMYEGCTVFDLMQLFSISRPMCQRKLSGVPPTGKRGSYDIWSLKTVAGLFVKPVGSMQEYLKAARPGDLPNELQKEYWNGLRAKQAFMEKEGTLWQTEQVVALFGEAFQLIRTSMMLLPDELERRSAMSDVQRTGLQEGIDSALDGMQKVIQEAFKDAKSPKNLPGVYNISDEVIDEFADVFEPVEDEDDEL